ncbi:MAG: histidine kinase [Nonlabens sp.]
MVQKIYKLIVVSLVIALAISGFNIFLGGDALTMRSFTINTSINFMFAVVLTIGNTTYFEILSKWLPWERKPVSRMIVGALGSVVLSMLLLFLLLMLTRVLIFDTPLKTFMEQQRLEWYVFGLVITIIVALAYHAVFFYKELQSRKVQEQKAIAGSATAQFDALKNQLDPHFLFNSLNVLVSLIEENPKAAVKFTTALSKVYRYVLEQRSKQLVSVEEELKFARSYVSLLKMRFEDSLTVDIEATGIDNDLQIVPLSLQLLLENAVKHNVVSDKQPLYLKIFTRDNQLIVENNLQIKEVLKKGSNVGLNNITERYALLSNKTVHIYKTKDAFMVKLPLLQPDDINLSNSAPYQEDLKLLKAKDKVASIKAFYNDVAKTILIIAMLSTINYFTSDFPWAIFPAIGMSLGLGLQYLRTFDNNFFLGRKWEEKKIEEMMNNNNF